MKVHIDSKGEKLTTAKDSKELILWYGEASNIEFKIKTLIDICKIDETESINIAIDSLLDGYAKITTGNNDRLLQLQKAFQKQLITTTIE